MDNKIYRSIQLGLRGEAVKKFVNEWIVNISDVTDYVKELSKKKDSGDDISAMSRHRGYHSIYNEFVKTQLDAMDVSQSVDVLQKQVYNTQKA